MKPVHILLVEDNEGDILLTTDALSEGKIHNAISVVKDGWEAMQFLEQNDNYQTSSLPDIILMDINLPKMNGHEVVKFIKASDRLKHIPVIMLTTSTSPRDVLESYQNMVNCFITKPVEVKDFLGVISSIENFWISIVQLPSRVTH